MQLSSLLPWNKGATFKGGVHPSDEKHRTEDLPIVDFMDPQEDMVFPMLQHLGAPCAAIVKKGDLVLRDQLIGEPKGLGAPIYSSVSGTVKDVKPMQHPNGTFVQSVIIENDHQYSTMKHDFEPASYKELTREEILERIRFSGVVGMGGAGFPTAVKLNPPSGAKIEYVLLNASECEPYLTSDYRVMLEDTWRLVNGIKIALSLFPGAKGLICIENNKPKAIETVKTYIEDEPDLQVIVLQTKYPQGGEKQLINAACGREVPSGKLPADIGCVVINADTSIAISRAVTQARPLQRRIVTIVGDCVENARNYRVRIGTSMEELVSFAGLTAEPSKIIIGGPMMGIATDTLKVPIIKTSSCILLLNEKSAYMPEKTSCIRCGKCIEACPMRLQPYMLNELIDQKNYEGFIDAHGMDCIECGACTFICPAKQRLTANCKVGRSIGRGILQERAKTAKGA